MEQFLEFILSFFEKLSAFFLAFLAALGIGNVTPEEPAISQTTVFSIGIYDTIRAVEGGCTDGRYVYQILIDPDAEKDATPCKILKIDSTDWKTVTVSETLNIDHANDVTYDSTQNLLLVSNNIPNYTTVTAVDPLTLTVKSTYTLPQKIYSIVYVGSKDCYYAGISKTYNIVQFSKNFEELGTIEGINSGYTRQGIESDGAYLYCIFYKENTIYKYDFEGNYQGRCVLPDTANEAENMFFLGGNLYVGYNIIGKTTGGFIAKVENAKYTKD